LVGTHFPEERDVVQSALQRMREAFDGLREGRLDPGHAQDLFLAAYDDLLDVTSVLLLTRRGVPASRPVADRD
jgi:hypothetical protein